MSDTLVPDHVDARKIFATGAVIRGCLPIAHLPRLNQSLADEKGEAQVELQFSTDEARRRIISGSISARVNAVCQRCLEAVSIELQDTLNLAVVMNEEQAKRLPAELDPWLMAENAPLQLAEVIEEQLILAMPLVSYHPEGQCTGLAAKLRDERYSADNQPQNSRAENPFAVLQKLKKDS